VIYGSLVLILVAVGLFGLGLVQRSNAFLIGSIGASLLAAILVVLGVRQAAAAGIALRRQARERAVPAADGLDHEAVEPRTPGTASDRGRRRGEGTVYGGAAAPDTGTDVLVEDEPDEESIPDQASGVRHLEFDLEEDPGDDDPPDEPAAQLTTPADAERVARMSAEVLVIDGRPRYHQAGCVHLLRRESQALPVSEAVELGFTPCSLCEPDSALLAEARGV
jgi:hypothetical protein